MQGALRAKHLGAIIAQSPTSHELPGGSLRQGAGKDQEEGQCHPWDSPNTGTESPAR